MQTVKKSSQQYATRKWKNTFNIGHVRSLTILRYYDITIFSKYVKQQISTSQNTASAHKGGSPIGSSGFVIGLIEGLYPGI